MDVERYLDRLDLRLDLTAVPSFGSLARLQAAHVHTVPWETLSINGDPTGRYDGDVIVLDQEAFLEKVVDRRRGGYCFELNGAFGWLLDRLGFELDRVAACVLSDDGTAGPPANHMTHLVTLDRRYVVDVGTVDPIVRRPIPVDGSVVTDDVGIDWRVVESDRDDADYLLQYREPAAGWADRYLFRDESRDLSYFEATNEYFQHSPESGFREGPTVARATADGFAKLRADELLHVTPTGTESEPVAPDEWHDVLEREFDLRVDPAREECGARPSE